MEHTRKSRDQLTQQQESQNSQVNFLLEEVEVLMGYKVTKLRLISLSSQLDFAISWFGVSAIFDIFYVKTIQGQKRRHTWGLTYNEHILLSRKDCMTAIKEVMINFWSKKFQPHLNSAYTRQFNDENLVLDNLSKQSIFKYLNNALFQFKLYFSAFKEDF